MICLTLYVEVMIPVGWKVKRVVGDEKQIYNLKLETWMDIENLTNGMFMPLQPDGIVRLNLINWQLWTKGIRLWEDTRPDMTAGKFKNRLIRSINGNRNDVLKIIHWNVGSCVWPNKLLEI